MKETRADIVSLNPFPRLFRVKVTEYFDCIPSSHGGKNTALDKVNPKTYDVIPYHSWTKNSQCSYLLNNSL